jgi:hypothetical protein
MNTPRDPTADDRRRLSGNQLDLSLTRFEYESYRPKVLWAAPTKPGKVLHVFQLHTRRNQNMKQIRTSFKMISAMALLALMVGCATTDTHTDLLSAAGFKLLPADTPKKQELLKTLTPGKLTLITWKGKQFYVQPDVPNNQAYVGTPAEYQTYQQLRLARQLSNDNLMAAQMNQNALMGWGAWGPGFYGGFYGPRWR